jgi:hypothetical protein
MQKAAASLKSHLPTFLVFLVFLDFPKNLMAHREKSTFRAPLESSQPSIKTGLKKERLPNTRIARCAIPQKIHWLRFLKKARHQS